MPQYTHLRRFFAECFEAVYVQISVGLEGKNQFRNARSWRGREAISSRTTAVLQAFDFPEIMALTKSAETAFCFLLCR